MSKTFASPKDLAFLAEFTLKDVWLDAATGLPVKLAFGGAILGVQLDSKFIDVFLIGVSNGLYFFPFKIDKSWNGTSWMTIKPMNIRLLFAILTLNVLGADALQPTNTASQRASVQRKEELRWAKKEHLSVTSVRSILSAAGLKGKDDFRIENLDAHTLSSKNQILLSTWEVGTGKCLTVHVLERRNNGFQEVWSTGKAGEDNFCSPGVCGGANTYATSRQIVVQVPLNCDDLIGGDQSEGKVEIRCVTFSQKDKEYVLLDSKEKTVPVGQYKKERHHCS